VHISVLHPADLSESHVAAWHAMQARCEPLVNPFLCPEFTTSVGMFRPRARVAVISEGSSPVGFFPFEQRQFGVGVPIGSGLTDCQGLVSDPGLSVDAADLLEAAGLSAWHFDHLVAAPQQPFARQCTATASSPVIDLSDGFEAYERRSRARSPRFWQDTRRSVRKTEREIGPLKLDVDVADPRDLHMLLEWKSSQYRRTGRIDRFARRWVVDLVEHLLSCRENDFSGILSILYAGGTPIAGSFNLRYRGVLADWFVAYDTTFARYSPGRLHLVKLAEELPEYGVRAIDLGKGEKWYKEKFKSYDLAVGEGTATVRSALGLLHRARHGPPEWAVRQIRAHPRLFALADRVLKGYGRVRTRVPPAP
jgi:CelD/BcsL family acetyltransferase involved in cellulose biosynthesis